MELLCAGNENCAIREISAVLTQTLRYAPASPKHGISPDTSKRAWEFFAAPVDLIHPHIVTDVVDANAKKQVKSISYFNLMGVESVEPVDGVNIMVTTYTDGTTSSEKILK